MRHQGSRERDIEIASIVKDPTIKRYGLLSGVVQLDPLIAGRGARAGPGDLAN